MAPQDNPATAAAGAEARRIDDADSYAELRAWAFSEIDEGRPVEDIVADLAASDVATACHPHPRQSTSGGVRDWFAKLFHSKPR